MATTTEDDVSRTYRPMNKAHPTEGHPGGWAQTCHPCALERIRLLDRELDIVDDALGWKFSGKGRIETVEALKQASLGTHL